MGKTFTLGEAQTLLPVLQSLITRAQRAAGRALEVEGEIERLAQRIFLLGGVHVDVAAAARRKAACEIAVREARDTLAEIEAIGVHVHDLEEGLLDIPSIVDGAPVMLCWKLGEESIESWHDAGEEPTERRPLSRRGRRAEEEDLPN